MVDMAKINNKLYIIISLSAIVGGIETLAIRIANKFGKKNRLLFISPVGPVVNFIDNEIAHYPIDDFLSSGSILKAVEKNLSEVDFKNIEAINIWISHPVGILPVYMFQKKIYKKYKINSCATSGIFIPATRMETSLLNFRDVELLMANQMLKYIPSESIYFMSESVKQSFIDVYGNRYGAHRVVKLPLDAKLNQWKGSKNNHLRIISIGRVDKMKLYNLSAPSIVRNLMNQHISCYWDIYGEGEMLDECINESKRLEVDGYIKYKGTLDYREFHSKVIEYDVFVGMGTAALEAAQTKIPVILALGWERNASGGFLSESYGDSVGEPLYHSGQSIKTIETYLSLYSRLTLEERAKLGVECNEAVFKKVGNSEVAYEQIFERSLNVGEGCKKYFIINILNCIRNIKIFIKKFRSAYEADVET